MCRRALTIRPPAMLDTTPQTPKFYFPQIIILKLAMPQLILLAYYLRTL